MERQLDVMFSTFPARILAAALALQLLAGVVLLLRGSAWGGKDAAVSRPALGLLGLGAAAGVWYAALQRDIVMAAAEALAFVVCARLVMPVAGRSARSKKERVRG